EPVVKILNGNTFVVSDERGDIEASLTDPTGLFSFDTRYLSHWVLTVNGERLTPLSTDDLQYFETRFFLVPGTGTVYVDAKLSVIRERTVGDGFHETLSILNHDATPARLTVRIDADSDFADLFEVKDALQKKGSYAKRADDTHLLLSYVRDEFDRATSITSSQSGAFDEHGVTFDIEIAPHGTWRTELDVAMTVPNDDPQQEARTIAWIAQRSHVNMAQDLERWLDRAPVLQCDWEPLQRTY